ncbi:hypothetical protein E3N88_17240 [Mikania micrantha]|uniref:HMA domain-containing protein n=1 Tax=Mikania micrantha TaxID=192012 RepID=A0A5N6NRU3_9ASTR|nr:hypothetical protein E3N88_17240 [Mikania micrantha]
MEKPHVTEIKVRIDCNGCVQKIKKALHGINGIDNIYIDVPQQKLTIIGLADPEKIVKAIKKTRKLAIISSELTQPYLPTEPLPGGFEPTSDPSNPPPTETVLPCKPIEPQKEPENPPLEPAPTPTPTPAQEPPFTRQQLPQISRPKEGEEVDHVVHHYPPNHSDGRSHERAFVKYYSSSPSPVYKHGSQQSIHVNHSYNTYKPTPHDTQYNRPEPSQPYTNHGRAEPPPHYANYSEDYNNSINGNGNIISIFSDENPNACAIV